VPAGGNLISIAAGSVVTIDQAVAYAELNVNGTLQWGATSFPVTIGGNITINSGGKYLAYTSAVGGATGTPTTLGGNFINNGYANFAVGTTTGSSITFNGAGSTLGGSGVFEGDGTRGIIRTLDFLQYWG
jgi:trimeric autotransporter adhesin